MIFRESVEGLPRSTFCEPLLRGAGHPRHQDDDGQFRARVREVRRGQVDLRIAGGESAGGVVQVNGGEHAAVAGRAAAEP